MIEKFKQEIMARGYKLISETDKGVSFANEDTQFGVILLKKYTGIHSDEDGSSELHDSLKKLYPFAEKSTVCVMMDAEGDKEKIQRDEYFFSKIFTDRINILPERKDKKKTILFSPMTGITDVGDYTVNPFDYFDGLCVTNYLAFLAQAKDRAVVKYPKIVDRRYFVYLAQKLYSVDF